MSVRVSPRSGSTASSVPRCRHLPETLPADGPLAGRGFSPLPGRASPAAALARNGPPIRTAIAAGFWRWERGGHGVDLPPGRSRLWVVISVESARHERHRAHRTALALPSQGRSSRLGGPLWCSQDDGAAGPQSSSTLRRMDLWRMALDLATEARDDIIKQGISMTPDQKLYTARIYATLAVAQELAGDPRAPGPNAQGAAGVVTD